MELPRALDNLCFTKSYFMDGIVIIRDYPITLHNTTTKSPLHKIQKKVSQGKKGAKVMSSTQDGGRKSRMKKLVTEKYDRGEKADSDEGNCAPKKIAIFIGRRNIHRYFVIFSNNLLKLLLQILS